ncbi:PAS domain-containing protein [Pararhodobacter sp. CCB-MM2]|uniref:PAS domain-containing protein n=1 Tax=Pararhodobacter sp. CCB-MM2 TaxID=1786003 RepID=UPI0013143313|nr:PAS domain-containing protein [Pararhodobacter sp. CCB-MM2]
MILAQETLGASALSTVVGYLAQRTNVCAKVIDREGRVVAVNRRGLELLEAEADDVCGEVWAQFWTGDEQATAAGAVECAFAGKPNEFVGTFRSNGRLSAWEVECLPLEWEKGAVSKVLVLSSRMAEPIEATEAALATHPQAELLAKLSETLHAMTNVSTVSTSGANLLRRGVDGDRAKILADALEDAGRRASAAIQELGELLNRRPS